MEDGEIRVSPVTIRQGGLLEALDMEKKLGHRLKLQVYDLSKCIAELGKLEDMAVRDGIATHMYDWVYKRVYHLGYVTGGRLASEFMTVLPMVSAEKALWLDERMPMRSGNKGGITYDQAHELAEKLPLWKEDGSKIRHATDLVFRSDRSWEWFGIMRQMLHHHEILRSCYSCPGYSVLAEMKSSLRRNWKPEMGNRDQANLTLLRTWWAMVQEEHVPMESEWILRALQQCDEVCSFRMEPGGATVKFAVQEVANGEAKAG